MKKNFKFYCGIVLLIYSFIPYVISIIVIPFFQTAGKLLSSISLLIASAEAAFLISIILLGKPFIQLIKKEFLTKYIFPPGDISKTRHYCGVILFFISFTPYILTEFFLLFDLPDEHSTFFLLLLLLGNFLFVISLVVLGTNFWEKLKNLFRYAPLTQSSTTY